MKKYNLCIYYNYGDTDEIAITEKELKKFIAKDLEDDFYKWRFHDKVVFVDKIRSVEWWELSEN